MPTRHTKSGLAALFFSSVLAVACSDVSLGTSTGSQGTAAPAATGTETAPTVRGLGCGLEPETNTILCSAVSVCPNLIVNQDQYPGCGFRVSGTTFDLQCACGADLCPIGTPRTCTQAKQLLDNQNRLLVCAQTNEGRCLTTGKATGTPAPSSTNTRGCDPQCMVECARSGAGNCNFVCGC